MIRNGENEYLIAADGAIFPLADLGVVVVGVGDIPISYLENKGYGQHGTTVSDWLLEPRVLTFAFSEVARKRQGAWSRRSSLIDIVKPNQGVVTYRQIFSDGSRRDIDGRLETGMAFTFVDGKSFDVAFALRCPNPTFYDPSSQSAALSMTEADAFVLPFSLPDDLYLGGGSILDGSVNNPGSWRAWPVITITGPYSRLLLVNDTTGASFTLGVPLAVTETMVIDLTPGAQTILRNGISAWDEIEGGNLFEWYFESGENEISGGGSGLDANTTITFEFNPRYVAI